MKKRNVKLLVSGLTLGLAALTTVGTTYAWFTTTGDASVSGMNITAQGEGNGIFISTDNGTTYNRSVDLSDLYFKDKKLSPATSLDGKTFSYLNSEVHGAQKVNGNYVFSYGKVDTTNEAKYYVGFDLEFAVTADTSIYFYANNVDGGNEMKKVSRMSVSVYESDDNKVFNNNSGTATTYIFEEKAADLTTDYALEAMNKLYGKTVVDKSYGIHVGDTLNTTNRNEELNNATLLSKGHNTPTLLVENTKTYALENKVIPGSEGQFKFARVHFNFWIEGNDYLCSNKAIAQSLAASLVFISK